MPSHEGACHCGAIGFRFETALEPSRWSVRACLCRFCRAHAALSCSDPRGSLAFVESRAGALERYRFGLKTADFLLCRRCGVYIGAAIETPAGRFGIVNTRALRDPPADLPAPQPMDYEGEDVAARNARRAARWTPLA
jgi:hypothetical protein